MESEAGASTMEQRRPDSSRRPRWAPSRLLPRSIRATRNDRARETARKNLAYRDGAGKPPVRNEVFLREKVDALATNSNRLGDRAGLRGLHPGPVSIPGDRRGSAGDAPAGNDASGDRSRTGRQRKDGVEGSGTLSRGSLPTLTCRGWVRGSVLDPWVGVELLALGTRGACWHGGSRSDRFASSVARGL